MHASTYNIINMKTIKLYKIFNKPPFFLSTSHYMNRNDNPIKSTDRSRKAIIVPYIASQFGSFRGVVKSISKIFPYFKTSIKQMRISAKYLKNNPKLGKNVLDSATRKSLEEYAITLGVSKFAYTEVNHDYIFEGFEILYDNAMVLTMEMNRDCIKSSPSDASSKEVWRTYAELDTIVNKLSDFLRNRGYNCHPNPAQGGDLCTVPLAQDACLGVIGKNGILISPEFGPSIRLAAIFIDVNNLPVTDIKYNEYLWIQEFCKSCNKCIENCPAEALYQNSTLLDDGYNKYVDGEKCALPFSENCVACIKFCPFIHGHYDTMKKSFYNRRSKL